MTEQPRPREPQVAFESMNQSIALLLADPMPPRSSLGPARWALHVIDHVRGQDVIEDPRSAGAALMMASGMLIDSLVASGQAVRDQRTGMPFMREAGTAVAETLNALAFLGHLLYTGRDDLEQLREAWS